MNHILQKHKRRIFLLAVLPALIFSAQAQTITSQPAGNAGREITELSLEELLNLKVTVASKRAEKISDAAGVISVLTKEELEAFGGLTLRDILERMPSMIASSAAFTERYGLASRGDQTKINSGHNLILINGRPSREVVEGGISSEMYASFPGNRIERIEVIRGPGSVLYGSNAFSAVINIITEKAEENNVSISALTGSRGGHGVNGQSTLALGDVAITLGGRYMRQADWETPFTAASMSDPGATERYDITIPDIAGAAYADVRYKNLSIMLSHNQYETGYFQSGVYRNEWKKDFANVGYGVRVNDKWDMDLNLTYNYATLDSDVLPDIYRKSQDMVAEWTNHLKLSDKLGLVVGGLYNNVKGKEEGANELVISDKSRGNLSVYSQADFWLLNNLKLIGGLQANKSAGYDLNVVPRGGAIWYPVKRINIKALYSQAYRAASVNEFSMNYPGGLIGNANLAPEEVATIDLGINYLGEKMQGGINFFHSKLSNIISPGPVTDPENPPNIIFMYINQGEINFNGLEVEGKYYVARNLFLTGSMLYQTNENDQGQENVTHIANFGAKAGISYRWKKGITASLFNIYQGDLDDKYTNVSIAGNPRPGSYNILNMYCSADLVKLFNMNVKQGISVFFQGNNLLDNEVWSYSADFSLTSESLPSIQGRALYVGLRASLR